MAAFYAIVHFRLDEVAQFAAECARVLAPGAWTLVAFHTQLAAEESFQRSHQVAAFLDHPVPAIFTFFAPDEVVQRLEAVGLQGQEVLTRPRYPEVEAPTNRSYLWAQRQP